MSNSSIFSPRQSYEYSGADFRIRFSLDGTPALSGSDDVLDNRAAYNSQTLRT